MTPIKNTETYDTGIRGSDHATPSNRKGSQSPRRKTAAARWYSSFGGAKSQREITIIIITIIIIIIFTINFSFC
jgi:hypothetical protein